MNNEPCVHHWDIDPAEGPTSEGVCRKCGATKEFSNRSPLEGHYSWAEERDIMLDGFRRLRESARG